MAKNKPLKDEEYDSIDEIQTTLDRHTDKLNRIEAGLVSIKSEIASVSKTGGHNMDSSGDRQFIQLRNLFILIIAHKDFNSWIFICSSIIFFLRLYKMRNKFP